MQEETKKKIDELTKFTDQLIGIYSTSHNTCETLSKLVSNLNDS